MIRFLLIAFVGMSLQQPCAFSQAPFTWNEAIDLDGGGHGLDCSNRDTCVAALSTVINGDTYILRSSDRGTTWDTTLILPFDVSKEIVSPSPGHVQFLSDSIVLVQLDSAYVLRSIDAGINWQRIAVSSYNSGVASQLTRISDKKAACVVKYSAFRTQTNAQDTTFISMDAGQTWAPAPVQPKLSYLTKTYSVQRTFQKGVGSFGTIVAMTSEDGDTIVVTETSDDGTSWEQTYIQPPTSIGAFNIDINYFDERHAVLTGLSSFDTGFVMKTWDGGNTWSTIFFGQIREESGDRIPTGMLSSNFLDSAHGIAATKHGIIETSDGGRTWRKGHGEASFGYQLYYLDTATALGVLSAGTIIVGNRTSSSVPDRPHPMAPIRTHSVHVGELLDLALLTSNAIESYTIFDVLGIVASRGTFHRPTPFLRAPSQPGLYFVTLEDDMKEPVITRLLVLPN